MTVCLYSYMQADRLFLCKQIFGICHLWLVLFSLLSKNVLCGCFVLSNTDIECQGKQRWNQSGFSTTDMGTGLSRSDQTGRSETQVGTGSNSDEKYCYER